MKLLLTGSSGFIGTHFIRDNPSLDIIPFSFSHGEIDAIQFNGIEAVVHLAAMVHRMDGGAAEDYEAINVTRTLQLAQKTKDSGVRRFVFISTVKVYGEECDETYTEDSPCNPQDDYGKSKYRAEKALTVLEDSTFSVSIIRIPVVYGSGVKGNIKTLLTWIKGPAIFPFSEITNRRSLVYVGNVCALIRTVLERGESGIFLIADDEPVSTTRLIRTIASALHKSPILLPIPFFKLCLHLVKPQLYQRLFGNFTIDDTKTRQRLDFVPPYSTDEGIQLMIQGTH